MCRLRTIGFIAASILIIPSAAHGQFKHAAWRSDYDAARKEAIQKGLPLFLVVYSENCVHCQRLETGPLRDRGVVELLNKRFVPFRIDGAKAPKLIEALRIQAFPTVVVAGTDGKVVAFLEGYQEPRVLADHLQQALTSDAARAVADRPEAKAVDRSRRAKDLLAQAREAVGNEKYSTALDLCEILETNYSDLSEGKEAAELAVRILSSPDKLTRACESMNERLATMYAALGESWAKKGDIEQARAAFEKAVRTAPASPIARRAQARLAELAVKPAAVRTNYGKLDR
jgi:thioredoxin-like negative regulator of GroEL